MTVRQKIRCAIYTRKSTDEGLDQDFNSLDAQNEACAAYIASQRHEGWKRISTQYDDGGVSGGTLERPALQRLMADIDAGRVDMVVVYKIDRLTRSLSDFSRLVDRLEKSDCSFVSVTQAFNTSTSMGRLTLNVLLSFAQFEREVTAERIRDKIAASKKKGMWMGGTVPLGYDKHPDPKRRELVVNTNEAKTVVQIFELYVKLGCLRQVEVVAKKEALISKRHVFTTGRTAGGRNFSRGQIYYLLRNPVYCGKIRHKEKIWPGLHEAVVSDALWESVQAQLEASGNRPRSKGENPAAKKIQTQQAWLTGKLRDETGNRLTPTHTTRNGRRLRYYVSNRLISGGTDPSGWRLPAPALEQTITGIVKDHLIKAATFHSVQISPDASSLNTVENSVAAYAQRLAETDNASLRTLLKSGILSRKEIKLTLDLSELAKGLNLSADEINSALLEITAPFQTRRRGVETRIIAGEITAQPDPKLSSMLRCAHGWCQELKSGTQITALAARENTSESYVRIRSKLAFLSPKIQTAILNGTQPVELSLETIIRQGIPLNWEDQERRFGF